MDEWWSRREQMTVKEGRGMLLGKGVKRKTPPGDEQAQEVWVWVWVSKGGGDAPNLWRAVVTFALGSVPTPLLFFPINY
jgi:hypothetical protein